MTEKRFKKMLSNALNKLYKKDKILITRGGMEQACVARVFYYLQKEIERSELKTYNLDCEYNKDGEGSKWVNDVHTGEQFKARPDMLLHKRGNNDNNIVIVEFKGWWNKSEYNDVRKLEAFTDQNGRYRYRLGIYVKLNKENWELRCFENKREVIIENII